MDYWKLGCDYWGKGRFNFYSVLIQHSIVICGECDMKIGDAVAIADGYTVKAIAIVTSKRQPVTELPLLENPFKQYEIEYKDSVTVANANIIELPKNEQFRYQLRQGICQIQKPEIIQKIKVILDNIDKMPLYKKLIETYKTLRRNYDFDDDKNYSYEIYKWQLITSCQGKTPIEIVTAHNANPSDSPKGGFYNLIDQPRDNAVLKYVCGTNQSDFEILLNNLTDETIDIDDRLYNYKVSMSNLLKNLGTDYNSKANDERTAAIILTCWNPKHYTFYKDSFYKKLCAYLGVPTVIAGKKYGHYLQLIQPLVKLIEQDTELKTIISNSAIANLLQSDLLLAQDICYELFDAFPNLLSTRTTMQNSKIQEYINLLRSTHNLILTGAPGTGKTYLAKEIAQQMIFGEIKPQMTAEEQQQFNEQCGFVQFHPSYDYTDFVEGLRPTPSNDGIVGFERKDGVFKAFCSKAIEKFDTKNFDKAYDNMLETLGENTKILKTPSGKEFAVSANTKGNLKLLTGNEFKNNGVLTREGIKAEFSGNPIYNWWAGYYKGVVKYLEDNFQLVKSVNAANKKFVFIIDEINRGEISKIFGELFFSLDPGYRGPKGAVRTQYANMQVTLNYFDKELGITDGENYGHFFVPENVYIIGTMNDIDRSVESMDFAFRRRFAFKEIKADENVGMLENLAQKDEAIKRMKNLNAAIEKVDGLSSAYHIGASYFLKLKDHDGKFDKLWEYHLEGLLREYLRGTQDIDKEIEKLKTAYNDESDHNNGQPQQAN